MSRGPDPKHSDEEILKLFRDTADPVLFASEVAESLSTTRQTVYNRMVELLEKGYVRTKKAGKRSRIYWISYEGMKHLEDYQQSEGSQ